MSLAFKLPIAKDDGNPQFNGSIGAGDTTIALKTGHGARLPTIYTGSASSTGDTRTLNDTGDLGSVAVGDFIENTTDGSWAIVITAGASTVRTTPLRGGSDNTWQSGDTWAVNRFYCRFTKYDGDGNITQKEKVLVNTRTSDTITVTRAQDGDSALSFAADDYCNLMVLKVHVDEIQKAIREALSEIDDLYRGGGSYAAASGSSNAYAITLSPTVTVLTDITGKLVIFKSNHENTGASTLNVNGLGATAIKKETSTALSPADIKNNQLVIVSYDGTNFQLVSTVPAITLAALTVEHKTADYSVSATNDIGKALTNKAATGTVTMSLPTASAGLYYTFFCAAAQSLRISPASGDTIEYAAVTGILGIFSNTKHSSLELVAMDTDKWVARSDMGTWASTGKGYWMSGEATGPAATNIIAGFRFDTEAHANISATMDTARRAVSGTSSVHKGYCSGGNTGSATAEISALKFVDETEAVIAATLDTARYHTAGMSSSTKGYIFGGYDGSNPVNKIDDISFATEASAELVATVPATRQSMAGGQSSTKGYAFGASDGASPQTAIYALTFAGETTSTLSATLPAARTRMAAVSSSTKSYAAGGDNSGVQSAIYALTFAGETTATLGATLDTARQAGTGIQSTTKGYIGGGDTGSYSTKIDDLNFSSEASAEIAAALSAGRAYTAGVQNGLL